MKLSIAERFLYRLPISYPASAVILSVGIVLIISVAKFIDTGSFQTSFYFLGLSPTSLIVFILGSLALPTFALIAIKYVKDKLLSNESGIADLCPNGEETLQRVFADAGKNLPVVAIAVLLLLPTIINHEYKTIMVGMATTIVYPVTLAIVSLIYASFLWTFISIVYGIYKLGKLPLKLTPFYIDNTLGLKPLGNLSLQMAIVYFAGVFLILMQIFIIPTTALSTLVEIGLLIGLGVILFFLPLYTAHKRLVAEKKRYINNLRARLDNASFGIRDENSTFETLNEAKATGLIAYDIIERKLALISDWPIDPTMVKTLTALAISTSTTLVGRVILLILGI